MRSLRVFNEGRLGLKFYRQIKKAYERPSSEDESVYTAHGTASFGEFFSPPHEAIVPTERTNSVVSTCAFIFGMRRIFCPRIMLIF